MVQRESQIIATRGGWLVRGEIGIDEDGNDGYGPLSHNLGHDGSICVSQASRFILRWNLSHSCHVEALLDQRYEQFAREGWRAGKFVMGVHRVALFHGALQPLAKWSSGWPPLP